LKSAHIILEIKLGDLYFLPFSISEYKPPKDHIPDFKKTSSSINDLKGNVHLNPHGYHLRNSL